VGNQLILWWLNKLINVSGKVWEAGIKELKHKSSIKVKRTEIERRSLRWILMGALLIQM